MHMITQPAVTSQHSYDPDTYCWYAFSAYDSNHKYCCCVGRGDYQNWTQLTESPRILEIRQSIQRGERHPDCAACWQPESLGAVSTRQGSLQWIERTMPQGNYYDPRLRAIWLDTGTTCNLACRTCWADWSSSWVREFRDRWPDAEPPPIQHTDLDYLLTEDFSDLTSVIVIGGEPFLNLKYVEVLERMVSQGHSSHIKITCFTNGTLPFPPRLLALAPHFETFNLLVSVDGIGPAFDYIRTGGKWNQVAANIDSFFELADHNVLVMFTTVISAFNVLDLPEIYDYFLSKFRIPDIGGTDAWLSGHALYREVMDRGWLVNTIVSNPPHSTLRLFDQHQRQVIRDRLSQSHYDFGHVIRALDQDQHQPDLVAKFWEEAAWTQSYHGLAIQDHLPKLVSLLGS